MYKFVVVSVIALVVFHETLAAAKVKPAAAPEQSQIETLAGEARQIIKNVSEAIEGNLPDSKQVSQTLSESAQTFATKIKSLADGFSQQANEHKGDLEEIFKKAEDSLKATAAKLQEAIGPDATKKATELKDKIKETIDKTIQEAERLAKAAEPEVGKVQTDLKNAANVVIENALEAAKDLQKELNKNVAPKN